MGRSERRSTCFLKSKNGLPGLLCIGLQEVHINRMNLILAAEKPAVEWRGACRLHRALFPGKDRRAARSAGREYPNGPGASVRDPRFARFRARKPTGHVEDRFLNAFVVFYGPASRCHRICKSVYIYSWTVKIIFGVPLQAQIFRASHTQKYNENECLGWSVVYPPADCFANVNRP